MLIGADRDEAEIEMSSPRLAEIVPSLKSPSVASREAVTLPTLRPPFTLLVETSR